MPLTIFLNWRLWAAVAVVAGAIWLRHTGVVAERKAWEKKVAEANANARAEEQRRIEALGAANAQASKEREANRATANRAADAERRLRDAIAALRATQNPAPAGRSETSDTIGELFGDCAQKFKRMAEEADRAVVAGRLCERSYDSLTPRAKLRLQLKGESNGQTSTLDR